MFTLITAKLIAIVTFFYEDVWFYKPKVSRPANSEKYLVAKGFKGITEGQLGQLMNLFSNWDNTAIDIDGILVNQWVINKLGEYNKIYTDIQIHFIDRTIKFINENISKERYLAIIEDQNNKAISWCDKYKIGYILI